MIFKLTQGKLRGLAVLTPRQRPRRHWHVTLQKVVSMNQREIVSLEFVYGPRDATCCPSGKAATLWVLRNGHIRALRSVMLRKPLGT